MPRKQLSLQTLPQFDHGSIALAFDKAMRMVYEDLYDRPALGAGRSISIDFTMKPRKGSTELEDIEIEVTVDAKIPKRGVSRVVAANSKTRGFSFQVDSPNNPRQPSLLDGIEDPGDDDEDDDVDLKGGGE